LPQARDRRPEPDCQQQSAKKKWRRRPAAVQPARAGRSARRSSVAQLAAGTPMLEAPQPYEMLAHLRSCRITKSSARKATRSGLTLSAFYILSLQ
jgi:hypothetical protein